VVNPLPSDRSLRGKVDESFSRLLHPWRKGRANFTLVPNATKDIIKSAIQLAIDLVQWSDYSPIAQEVAGSIPA
jgi:hypothetical protein